MQDHHHSFHRVEQTRYRLCQSPQTEERFGSDVTWAVPRRTLYVASRQGQGRGVILALKEEEVLSCS